MKIINLNKKIIFVLFLILTAFQSNYGQITKTNIQNDDRKVLLKIKNADRSNFKYIPKKPGHYSAEDWRAVIDSTWGEGLPTEKKLQLFDRFWNDVDKKYPSFFNLNVNWDSLKAVYRPEVAGGVSRGRFAAIMCRMYRALSDVHTRIADLSVATDSLKLGTPLLVVDGNQSMYERETFANEYCHFGAGLSLLPDSSLLVYDVIANHPLGLEKGDVVMGYDGIPWKRLYKELLNDELPFRYNGTGSNPISEIHLLLTSAGENWHLFDTIDIVKHSSGETLHLSTSLLQNKKMKLLPTVQLPVNGVPFPDIDNGHWVSWGVIEGTSIGYIYVWNWTINGDFPYPTTSTGDDFKSAIQNLINDYKISSLIIDSRFNLGGWATEYMKGLSILFNEDQDNYRQFIRKNADDHFSMMQYTFPPPDYSKFKADRYLFDRPIALLTSPFSVSCGDFMPLQMRYHPMVRSFGLGTNGAFGSVYYIDITDISPDWIYRLTFENNKVINNPDKYLTHLSIPPDEEVWFTKESIVKGEDDVVNAALNWVNNLVYGHSLTKNTVYCRPDVDTLMISALVENPNSHQTSSKIYIKNLDGSIIDSLGLSKTGLSDNSEIWTGNYLAPDSEDIFSLSLSAKDIDESKTWTTNNISRFTTAGPVVLDSISIKKSPHIPYVYEVKPFLKNESKSATIENASVKLISNDQWATIVSSVNNLPDINPSTAVAPSSSFLVGYIDSLFPGYFNFKVEIMSDGWTYWTDSIKTIVTGVDDKFLTPLTFNLEQNYPNPFNPSTMIKFVIPKSSFVNLTVYDVLGRQVETLINEVKHPGDYEIEFDASELSSGIYFYRIQASDFTETKKMILLK